MHNFSIIAQNVEGEDELGRVGGFLVLIGRNNYCTKRRNNWAIRVFMFDWKAHLFFHFYSLPLFVCFAHHYLGKNIY
jgi:ABC-type molybdate transport system permease subunit